MSTNRHAIIRYHALDECFSNHHNKYFVDDLLRACEKALLDFCGEGKGIQRRQLFDDMRFMKSEAGYRIVLEKKKEGQRYYYRYKDPDFTIRNVGLNNADASQVKAALQVLSRFSGLPQFAWVEETVAKLESRFNLKLGAAKIIAFDENKDYIAVQKVGILFNYILNKKVLKITYQSYKKGEPKEMVFHPYFLKEYNNRWFCFGLCEGFTPPTNIALDRILNIEESNSVYIPNTTIDFETFFDDFVGVTVDREMQTILLKISKVHWPYIESKPLHHSQKIKTKGKEFIIISIDVRPNYELQSLLLSHGNEIEVIEPEWFRNLLLKRSQPKQI